MVKGKQTIQRRYCLFNAENQSVGRLATKISKVLRGKNKVGFTPHIDGGDFAVVINSDKLKVTGNKLEGKVYHRFSGYPGGITSEKLKDLLARDSRKVIENALWGMLPKNKLRNKMLNRLFIYKDENHPHKIDVEVNK